MGESCLWLILIGVVVHFGLQLASRLLVVMLPVRTASRRQRPTRALRKVTGLMKT